MTACHDEVTVIRADSVRFVPFTSGALGGRWSVLDLTDYTMVDHTMTLTRAEAIADACVEADSGGAFTWIQAPPDAALAVSGPQAPHLLLAGWTGGGKNV